MTELVEVGEEIGGDLESVEVKDEVQSVVATGVMIIAAVVGGCTGLQPLLQAAAKQRQKSHGQNDVVCPAR